MATSDWSSALTARIAKQLRSARQDAGLTVAEAADACAELGLPVQKTTITNLETGRRSSVDLAEFLVLAEVYGMPPISLLFPLGEAASVSVLPDRNVPMWDAVAWFTGEAPQVPAPPEGSAREILDTFRAHSDAVRTALASSRLAKERRRKASTTLDPQRRESLLKAAESYEQVAYDDCRELQDFRDRMRERGLALPALPEELQFVDETTGENKDSS